MKMIHTFGRLFHTNFYCSRQGVPLKYSTTTKNDGTLLPPAKWKRKRKEIANNSFEYWPPSDLILRKMIL